MKFFLTEHSCFHAFYDIFEDVVVQKKWRLISWKQTRVGYKRKYECFIRNFLAPKFTTWDVQFILNQGVWVNRFKNVLFLCWDVLRKNTFQNNKTSRLISNLTLIQTFSRHETQKSCCVRVNQTNAYPRISTTIFYLIWILKFFWVFLLVM